jgi:cell filamentation protein
MTAAGKSPRERDETRFTRYRLLELAEHPVRGHFDAAHLREINRRIFQDMPGAGYPDVTPGVYRPALANGDWMKERKLEAYPGDSLVAYSKMDAVAQRKLDDVLKEADPIRLATLDTQQFTARLAALYSQLDYAHPFPDGNSRTLRTFTKQLAAAAGYHIDWESFNRDATSREGLYIARDKSVNDIALPEMYSEQSMRHVIASMSQFRKQPNLQQLLDGVVRPLRAIAFEQLPEAEALAKHPELKPAYAGLHAMRATLDVRVPASRDFSDQVLLQVKSDIVKGLDSGRAVPVVLQALQADTRPGRHSPGQDWER